MTFRRKGTKAMNDSNQTLVPIGLLTAEGFDLGTVSHRFADELVINDAGLRCLPASTVRALIDERDQQQVAERERAERYRAELAAKGNPMRDRVRAIAATQERVGPPDLYAGGLR
jgi:hypothetical protein